MKILIVEDHLKLLSAISETLSEAGFLCEQASDFREAEEKVFMYEYDLLVIDINLPGGSGLDLIREIKQQKKGSGLIVISARNSLDNKIEGLELGADDYLTKPFDMAELVARVKSVIRRRNFSGSDIITFGEMEINIVSRSVQVKGIAIELTKSEYDILLFFMANPDRVLTKETIAEHIWGDNMDMADSFDFIYSHIKNLRKKLTDAGSENRIKAVYGVGYKWSTRQ
ncbi:MAG: response regulator transcription factor [Vicingus serpentipes]|nr:response regulator transcription factor [Vicingus serpentipes]